MTIHEWRLKKAQEKNPESKPEVSPLDRRKAPWSLIAGIILIATVASDAVFLYDQGQIMDATTKYEDDLAGWRAERVTYVRYAACMQTTEDIMGANRRLKGRIARSLTALDDHRRLDAIQILESTQ